MGFHRIIFLACSNRDVPKQCMSQFLRIHERLVHQQRPFSIETSVNVTHHLEPCEDLRFSPFQQLARRAAQELGQDTYLTEEDIRGRAPYSPAALPPFFESSSAFKRSAAVHSIPLQWRYALLISRCSCSESTRTISSGTSSSAMLTATR